MLELLRSQLCASPASSEVVHVTDARVRIRDEIASHVLVHIGVLHHGRSRGLGLLG